MSASTLQIGETLIPSENIWNLLNRYQLTSQFLRGLIIDQSIGAWGQSQPEPVPDADAATLHQEQIQKFKLDTWGNRLESYFMKRKPSLDRVIYSLIRTPDLCLARELYFRIQEGESTFAELARQYSQGPEAYNGGVLGPVPLSQPHPAIARLLSVSEEGQLWGPCQIADWYVIIRLEKMLPTRLDEAMQQQLLDEQFEQWLQEQIQLKLAATRS
jgi:parvulin-like peptidyl-prolyl isomerase